MKLERNLGEAAGRFFHKSAVYSSSFISLGLC